MSVVDSQWIFNSSGVMITAGILCFLLYLIISVYHLKQVHFSRYRLLTETIKFLGALLLLFTLFQPERHTRSVRNENARIAVIADATDSMDTRDIKSGGQVMSRKEWLNALMESEAWSALGDAVQLEVIEMGHADKPDFKETNFQASLAAARAIEQLAGVLVLSDGLHNAVEAPLPEILRLAEADIPVYAVEIGEETRLPDLILDDVNYPSYSIMNEALVLPYKVSNTLEDDVPVRVVLLANGIEVASQELTIPSGLNKEGALRWTPRNEGPVELTVEVESHPFEEFIDNNRMVAEVDIRKTLIRVLIIDSLPRWEIRYLRNALNRDPGVHVDTLLYLPELGIQSGPGYLDGFPQSRDAWSQYDVVFLGDVGLGNHELSQENLRALELLVREQGSGLVFLPGARGGQLRLLNTAVEGLLPVEYDTALPHGVGMNLEMRMELTREGRDHLLTQLSSSPARNLQIWRKLPGFYWYAPVTRARVGSEVLATHNSRRNDNGRIPLLVTRDAGTGHVLFMGTDGAWRWRRGVEDLYHYRFWGQVVRWMAHKRHMFGDEGARLFIQPERPEVGQDVTMTLSLRGAMALSEEVPFRLRVVNERGEVVSPSVTSLEGGGSYQAHWVPEGPGKVQVELLDIDGGDVPWFSSEFMVEGDIPEKVGLPSQPVFLQELAQITGGERVMREDAVALLERLERLPREQKVLTVKRIWQHPLWVISLFSFFGIYWILRKRQGWI
ncbi:hypothetical protein P3T73_10980 [Kiritimatiellota bacterium B12222]|nr:hypothetical protein P3T73_10980 [Kiritimatiellota bacterium B12222]